ncbi:MAG: hypothetical protein QCI00_08255, partial [Candidatus Thermoplasmatota archaeon]|nr:hypothetical protein [Candidatus Thermoplasmatota archaeon]
MNKIIVFGSILSVFVILMVPNVAATEYYFLNEANNTYFDSNLLNPPLSKNNKIKNFDTFIDSISLHFE